MRPNTFDGNTEGTSLIKIQSIAVTAPKVSLSRCQQINANEDLHFILKLQLKLNETSGVQ